MTAKLRLIPTKHAAHSPNGVTPWALGASPIFSG
jgi:hypothetical protein